MRTCEYDGCDRKHYAKGQCRPHYDEVYREANRERRNAQRNQNRRDNADHVRAYNARYYAEHRAREAERCRAWRQANAEQHAENRRRWIAANPEKAREQWAAKHVRRYSRIRATRIGPVDYAAVVARHGMECHLCGGDILTLADLHLDHVIPLALGGPHTEDNLRPAHALCNQRKGARLAAPRVEHAVASGPVPARTG